MDEILIEMHPAVAYNTLHPRASPLFRAHQNEISMEGGNLSEEVTSREFGRAILQRFGRGHGRNHNFKGALILNASFMYTYSLPLTTV